MRRYGFGVTAKVLSQLVREVLKSRAPERLGIDEVMNAEPLTQEQREAIREVLADELVARGFGPDWEPNERGRLLEAAIDWLGHK